MSSKSICKVSDDGSLIFIALEILGFAIVMPIENEITEFSSSFNFLTRKKM